MRLSEERIEVLAGRIADRLLDEELVDITVTERAFMDLVETWISADLAVEEEINEAAVERLRSYSRKIDEGSSEWEALLDQAKEDIARSRGYVIR